jgi:hypothetical protein
VRPLDASLYHWAREIPHAIQGLAVASGLSGDEEGVAMAGYSLSRKPVIGSLAVIGKA